MGDTQCRFLCWKGGILQKLATTRIYVLIFGLVGFVQFAVGSYQSAILTTVERRFQIPSKLSGVIISGVDIGTIICTVYLVIYGKHLHKPRAVGFGIFLISTSCILWFIPHVFYGAGVEDFAKDRGHEDVQHICYFGTQTKEVCTGGKESIPATIILHIGNIVFGIGACFYWVVGLTYIDDNARRSKTPFYLSITMFIRMFGPTLGFMMASYTLSIPVNLESGPILTENDPKRIGAWWLGFVILLPPLLTLLLFLCAFPRSIPKSNSRKTQEKENVHTSTNKLSDFRLMITRLMRNKVFVFNTLSTTLFMFGLTGLGVFGPKYMETQFRMSPSEASFMTGSAGLLCTGIGILVAGIVITYFKPNARKIALWNVITEVLDIVGYFAFAFIGCSEDNLQGHWEPLKNEWNWLEECNKVCACPPTIKYDPLCSINGNQLFYSPCHAGCKFGSLNKTSQVYNNCNCALDTYLKPGPCPVSLECSKQFHLFYVILCLLSVSSASGRAGNTLIQFRSVNEDDKAASLAITEAFLSIFAFVPAPIIFGILLDYTCIAWGESCGGGGNCWLYDSKSMRYIINFTCCVFLIFGTLADVVVWIYSSTVEVFGENQKEDMEEHENEVELLNQESGT